MTDAADRVRALMAVSRFEDARSAATRALASLPEDAELQTLLAQAMLGLDDAPGTLRAAERAIRLDPGDEHPHRLRAIALSRLGRRREAVSAAREAVRLQPHDWRTHVCLAQVAAGDSSLRGERLAMSAPAEALRLAPWEADVHFTKAWVAHSRDLTDEAAAGYRETLRIAPQHAAALHNLTLVEGRRGGAAIERFSSVLAIDPRQDAGRTNLTRQLERRVRNLVLVVLALTYVALISANAVVAAVALGLASVIVLVFVRSTRRLPRGAQRLLASLVRAMLLDVRAPLCSIVIGVLLLGLVALATSLGVGADNPRYRPTTGVALVIGLGLAGTGAVRYPGWARRRHR